MPGALENGNALLGAREDFAASADRTLSLDAELDQADVALIADCQTLQVIRARLMAAYARSMTGDEPELNVLHLALDGPWMRLIETPARTQAGKIAKARAALMQVERDPDGMINTGSMSEDLAMSALADILGVGVNDPMTGSALT